MTILQRIKAPKTMFFKRVQLAGLLLAFACVVVLLYPRPFPDILQQSAGYLCTGGIMATLVSQVTVGGKTNKPKRDGKRHTRCK